MNRRLFVLGVSSPLVLLPFLKEANSQPIHSSWDRDKVYTVLNKESKEVQFTGDLANDLFATQGKNAEEVIKRMYGTNFTVSTWYRSEKVWIVKFQTNDKRDIPEYWHTWVK